MTKVKYLVLFLITLAIILAIPNITNAATKYTYSDTEQGIEWSYELDTNENVVNLKCETTTVTGAVTIPSNIDGKTVISLKGAYNSSAFFNYTGITSVTIPNTIKIIGEYAFYGCTGLQTIIIPDSVTKIDSGAFENCSGLTSVTLSQNLSSIGSRVFNHCSGLRSLTIPNSVTTIGVNAFNYCSGLKSITLSDNITKIDNNTFSNCSGLTTVILPEKVTTIGSNAFSYCKNLDKILIPDSVASIGSDAFYACNKLTIYGNDGMTSKEYAQEKEIPFDYIANWDKEESGSDITPPTVDSITVPYSSVMNYSKDENQNMYMVPVGAKLVINVNFSEVVEGTTVPTLTIKFGDGGNIKLTEGTVAGSTITYIYTVKSSDKGVMTTVDLSGGNIKDAVGNVATLSCPTVRIQYDTLGNEFIYANGTSTDIAVESISLIPNMTIYLGVTSTTLYPTFNPSTATNKNVTWTSSNEEVATVDNEGKITPKKVGSTIITVITQDGNKKATCTLTVAENLNNGTDDTITKKAYGNHTYYIFDKSMTWEEAKAFCESQGGHLVTVNSREEQAFLESYIKEKGYNDNRFWIGASDTTGTWKWVTGEKFSYTNWGKNQPDQIDQSYAVIHGYEKTYNFNSHVAVGQWDNLKNDGDSELSNIYFICEWGDKTQDEDTTTAPDTKLPQTGESVVVIATIIAVCGMITVLFIKNRKYRDVK